MLKDKLKALMDEKQINANQLSKNTGIAYSSILDWTKGETVPKADKLLILAKYFGVTMEELLKGEA